LFTGCWDKKIRVWDFNSGELLSALSGHTDSVYDIELADNRLFSASFDKTIHIWMVEAGVTHAVTQFEY
ncbi:MAG: WD40 repeat domain-containing protein, partial [Nitrospirae bacterium]|nr:WD40 repeat domain-containing protein [Nitrospirota bacterium]